MFVTGLVVALIDTLIPVFIGRLVRLMEAQDRAAALHEATPALLGMAALVLLGRPAALLADSLVRNNAVLPGVTSLIRWQSHWHVVRQSWPFFQNDFAGRIANRVMQTSNALRESVVSCIRAVWYIVIYGLSALVLMSLADWRLAIPTVLWFAGYVVFPAPLRAAHARPGQGQLRAAQPGHGPRGGQLHQHPHGEALRTLARRRRLRARGGG
jgi:ATP-binding cassette subfamily B multidrug efflux pump